MNKDLLNLLMLIYANKYENLDAEAKSDSEALLIDLEEKHLICIERIYKEGSAHPITLRPEVISQGEKCLKQFGMI